MRLSRASWYCFRYLTGNCSSNHCGNSWRKSCSLLSFPNYLRSPVRRKPDHQRVSWTKTSSPIRNTRCVHSRSSRLGAPLLGHNFHKPTTRSFPFSIYTGIMSRGSMQQLLINGLHQKICSQEVYVLLICQGTTLRCPGGSQGLGNKLRQIARQ